MRRCLLVCSTFLVLFALFRTPPTLAQATWAPWAAGPTIPVPASPPQLQEIRSTPPPPTPSILSDEERTIIKALNEVHDWSFNDITLTDLAAQLKAWMPCRLDTDALNDVGISPSVVLGSLHGVKLSTQVVLHHLLANADMSWMVQDGELVLTTPERAEDHLRLLVLPVVDLIETPGLGEEGYDYDSLIELITSLVSPACWDEGGPGISTFGGALVFHQSWAISDQIEHLVETMRRAARNETDLTAIDMPWYGFPFDADLQPPVEQCLTLDLQSVTLDELVEKLSQQTTVPFRLDARALNDRNWCKSQRIRFTANNEPLSRSLRRALGAHDLSVGYDYPFLVVTTEEGADYLQSIRVYPIQDFLKDASHPVPTGTVRAATCDEWWRASAEELAALVTSVADRSAWSEVGGAGEIAISRVPPASWWRSPWKFTRRSRIYCDACDNCRMSTRLPPWRTWRSIRSLRAFRSIGRSRSCNNLSQMRTTRNGRLITMHISRCSGRVSSSAIPKRYTTRLRTRSVGSGFSASRRSALAAAWVDSVRGMNKVRRSG